MNEHCRIGLHNFTDWDDEDKGLRQSRKCRACSEVQRRPWEPDDKPLPKWRDPYDDLTR